MPQFRITDSVTGKMVTVSGDSAPSQAEAEQIFSDAGLRGGASPATGVSFNSQAPNAAPAQPQSAAQGSSPLERVQQFLGPELGEVGLGEDLARSAASGLVQGGAGLAGMAGDIGQFEKNPEYESGSPLLHRLAIALNPANVLPTSSGIMNAISPGGLYQPQTMLGQYTQTGASFAPAAIAPGSVAQKLARVAIPSAASETAGQLTKGTDLEVPARFAGSLLGSAGLGLAEGSAAERAQSAHVPSQENLHEAGGRAYDAIAGNPVNLHPAAVAAIGDARGQQAVKIALANAEINMDTPHQVLVELNDMLTAQPPKTVRTDTADSVRQAFDLLANSANRVDAQGNPLGGQYAARGWGQRSDEFERALQQTPAIGPARETWAQYRKSQIIDNAVQAATEAQGTPAGMGDQAQALRKQFLAIARSARMDNFTPAEQAAISDIGNGTITSNTLQQLGKFSPVRNLLSKGGVLFGVLSGHPELAALGAAGEAARQGSGAITALAARRLSEMIRAGQPMPDQMTPAVMSRLLGGAALAPRPYPFAAVGQ